MAGAGGAGVGWLAHMGRAGLRTHLRHRTALRFAAYEAANVEGVSTVDNDPEQYVHDQS